MRTSSTSQTIHFRRMWHFLVIQCLYLRNLLTGRRLELKFITESKSVMFANNYFTIYLEAEGCHQISVNGSIILPGNINLIRLEPAQLSGPLTLLFLGCSETIIKTYSLSSIHLQTKQLSNVLLEEPMVQLQEPVPLKRLQRVNLFSPTLPGTLQIKSRANPPKVRSSLIQVQLEPCQLPQFNP